MGIEGMCALKRPADGHDDKGWQRSFNKTEDIDRVNNKKGQTEVGRIN